MTPRVSIIVPVYGVEKYIERCARSLFEQTFNGIEYIFVNDCTRDKSIDILSDVVEDYSLIKEKVRILHHENNMGLPQARRTGILAARGDYIINFDSDDWVDRTIIDKMYSRAVKTDADIVICDYYVTDGERKSLIKGCYHSQKKPIIQDLCRLRVSWSVCNKMFKRCLLGNDTVFPTGNMGEDMGLIIPLVLKSSVFSYVPQPLYYYYSNPNSITHALEVDKILLNYESFRLNTEIVLDAFSKYGLTESFCNSIIALKWNVKKSLWATVGADDFFALWKDTYSDINNSVLLNSEIPMSEKMKFLLTYLRIYPFKKNRVI